MTAKEEIERRLKKVDLKKMAKTLFNKNFDDLSNDEYLELMMIADNFGSKYKRFYRFKNENDLLTIISNLVEKEYSPFLSEHNELKVILIKKNKDSFKISLEFYTNDKKDVPVEVEGKTYKETKLIPYRRVMIIEKEKDSKYLSISIDPIGDGSQVYKRIDSNISKLAKIINIDINMYCDMIEVDNAMHILINENILIPQKLISEDKTTKRLRVVQGQTKDNIKDDDIYISCKNSKYDLNNIRMKFQKETIEIFGKTLVKINTRANEGVTNELKKSIVPLL